MNPDTASTASTTATAGTAADDLTLGSDPPRPPVEDLYGTPYGPPPPYTAAPPYTGPSYAQEPYPSAPPVAPTDRRKRRQHWAGAILIVLGLLFLGNNLGLLWWIEFEYLMPLILVAAGAWLLFGRGRRG